MRRLSQGMVNLPKVKTSERMMPKIQLFSFGRNFGWNLFHSWVVW
jgi:hypothetical protein